MPDHPPALEFVLKALHHRYSGLTCTVDELVFVAQLVEKYQLHMALHHVAKKIYQPLIDKEWPMVRNWILLTWTFGEAEKFEEAVDWTIRNVLGTVGVHGELRVANGSSNKPLARELVGQCNLSRFTITLTN